MSHGFFIQLSLNRPVKYPPLSFYFVRITIIFKNSSGTSSKLNVSIVHNKPLMPILEAYLWIVVFLSVDVCAQNGAYINDRLSFLTNAVSMQDNE